MADGNIKVTIDVNTLFQKELVRVIQTLYEEHGVMVTAIDLEWSRMSDGTSRITSCETKTEFMP